MRTRLVSLVSGLGLCLLSLVVLALVAEVVLQVAVPLFKPRYTKVHPVLGWYHSPGASGVARVPGEDRTHQLSYNSHGFRSPEHRIERVAGRARIVVIGDSFVDGSEVEDQQTFTWLLQERLDSTDVINLGVYGFQTTQEFLTLQSVGLQFTPDAVMLVVVSNDLLGNFTSIESFGPAPRFVLAADSLVLEGISHPETRRAFRAYNLPAPELVHRHSLLYWALNHYIYHRIAQDRIRQFVNARAAKATEEDQVELFRRIVLAMQRLCEARDVPFVVVFAYLRDEVSGAVPSVYRSAREAIAADGVAVVDLLDPLREAQAASPPDLYLPHDIHWSEAGHRVVASALEPVVRSIVRDTLETAATWLK